MSTKNQKFHPFRHLLDIDMGILDFFNNTFFYFRWNLENSDPESEENRQSKVIERVLLHTWLENNYCIIT